MPLIVLEGLDGAGKSTQLRLLARWAAELGHETEFMHFPRFETPLYGEFLARFLRGEFGGLGQVDLYTVALMFAGDRAAAKPLLREWLDAGKWVFLDRYVYSNVAYQCAKVSNIGERNRLKEWILQLEFGIYGVPRPTVSLFLDVPFRFTEQRLAGERKGGDRDYLAGGRDVHEASLDLQKRVREMYLEVAAEDKNLKVVDCSDGGEDGGSAGGAMLPPEAIFEKIVSQIGGVL